MDRKDLYGLCLKCNTYHTSGDPCDTDNNIESCIEELENLINDEWVRDKVTALKQLTEQAIATSQAEALKEAANGIAEAKKYWTDRHQNHWCEYDAGYTTGLGQALAILADK